MYLELEIINCINTTSTLSSERLSIEGFQGMLNLKIIWSLFASIGIALSIYENAIYHNLIQT
ncbi:hypothetical protein SAMN05446037_1003223 [Anaerovirgula multivorans]|uniref:Uncharacterized protein n=1 Tax=Anaerovirgula multivorans TaxID=312168 RepID=A0A239BFF3_9FIRM|nr:hypothetical protein [Anaerovirgula multivorans]SNS06449.1 hypothetical protein SAMN05446037_1003223 [Anaerovirgula multivorans]